MKYFVTNFFSFWHNIFCRGRVEDTTLEAKDSPFEDRPSQGQGPRTQAQVFSKSKKVFKNFFRQSQKKKKIFKQIFQANSKKGCLKKFFIRPTKFYQFKKLKLCCPRVEDRAIFENLRHRGQGQGLDL